MSKKPTEKSGNMFTIFIVIAGLLVIGAIVMLNQKPTPNVEEIDQTVNAQGGANSGVESEITDALTNTNESVNAVVTNESTNTTQPDSNTNTAETNSYGVQLLAPATQSTEGKIITYQFGAGNVVNIMPPVLESLVLNETAVVSRTPVTVGSLLGERIVTKSPKDGSEIVLIHIVNGEYLYDIRGSENFVNTIDQYITFNN